MTNEKKYEKRWKECLKKANDAICDILSIKDSKKREKQYRASIKILNAIVALMDVNYVDRPTVNGGRVTLTINKHTLSILERNGKLISERAYELLDVFEEVTKQLEWLATQKKTIQNAMFYPIFHTCDGLVIFVYLATKTKRDEHDENDDGVLSISTFNYIAEKLTRLRNGCFICNSTGFDFQNSARIIRWFEGDDSSSEDSEEHEGIIKKVLNSGVPNDLIQVEIRKAFDSKMNKACKDAVDIFTTEDKSTRTFPSKEVVEAFYKNTSADFYSKTRRNYCHKYIQLKIQAGEILGSEYEEINKNSNEHSFAQSSSNNKNLFDEEVFNQMESSKNCAGLLFYIPHVLNNWLADNDLFTKIEMIKEAAGENPYDYKELGENVKDRDEIISAAKRFKKSPFSSYILSLDKDNFPKDMPKQACEAMWEIVKDEFDY